MGRQARPSRAGEHEPRQGRRWGFRSDSWLCCGLGTRACASTGAGGGGLERQRAVLTGCENTGVVAVQDGACACGRVCGAGWRAGGLCLGTGQLERRRRRAPPRRGRADWPSRSAPRRSAPQIHAADDKCRGSLSCALVFGAAKLFATSCSVKSTYWSWQM